MNESNNNQEKNKEKHLEFLLRQKYDKDRLTYWKKEMPIPEKKVKRFRLVNIRILSIAASFLLIISAFGIFTILNEKKLNSSQIAMQMLEDTKLVGLEDLEIRGNGNKSELNGKDKLFFGTIKSLKSDNPDFNKSYNLLIEYITSDGNYKNEALWFVSLIEAIEGNDEQSIKNLEKLSQMSSYKNKEIQQLLNVLK